MGKLSASAAMDIVERAKGEAAHADVDPELARQIASAEDAAMIEAVLVLRQGGANDALPTMQAFLGRLSRNGPIGAIQHTVLPRLGVLIVRAQARIIRQLIAQPAVVIASANRVHHLPKTDGLQGEARCSG